MARVVPSQVVELIDKLFSSANFEKKFCLDYSHTPQVAAIVSLVDKIPSELIASTEQSYVEFVASLAALRSSIESWQTRGNVQPLERLPGLGGLNPLALLRRALVACPDEFPSASTDDLTFINDHALRESLRIDLSSKDQALGNGEWKAATVLAGSIVEALLLWALKQRNTTEIQNAIVDLKSKSVSINHRAANLEDWVLHELIEVSEKLKIIKPETAIQARLAKDFRNLIHPGRNIRLGQICNRATTLSAVAAVEHVIEDLKKNHNSIV